MKVDISVINQLSPTLYDILYGHEANLGLWLLYFFIPQSVTLHAKVTPCAFMYVLYNINFIALYLRSAVLDCAIIMQASSGRPPSTISHCYMALR